MKGNRNSPKEELPPNNRIIIQNLDYETTEEKLSEYFSQYGKVLETEIPMNTKFNRSKGFGFITFSSVEEATKAITQEKHELDGRSVRTSYAKVRDRETSSGELEKGKKLYIGKLPWQVDQEELKKYFEKFGPVEDAFLPTVKYASAVNGYPVHKGFGFVTFVNEEDANKAVLAKNHNLKGEVISVRKAKPQEEAPKKENKSPSTTSSDEKKEVVVKRRGKQTSGSEQKSKDNKKHDSNKKGKSHEKSHEKPKKDHSPSTAKQEEKSASPSTNEKPSPSQESKEKNTSTNSKEQNKSKAKNPKKNPTKQAPPKQQSPPVNTQVPTVNPWSKSSGSAESSPQTKEKEFPSLAGKKKQKTPQTDNKGKDEKGKEEKETN